MTSYEPHKDYLSQNYDLDFLDIFNNWNILLKVNDATNNAANTIETNTANQEHQDYYNQQDQQYIGCKYNSDLEQVTLELVPVVFALLFVASFTFNNMLQSLKLSMKSKS